MDSANTIPWKRIWQIGKHFKRILNIVVIGIHLTCSVLNGTLSFLNSLSSTRALSFLNSLSSTRALSFLQFSFLQSLFLSRNDGTNKCFCSSHNDYFLKTVQDNPNDPYMKAHYIAEDLKHGKTLTSVIPPLQLGTKVLWKDAYSQMAL